MAAIYYKNQAAVFRRLQYNICILMFCIMTVMITYSYNQYKS